jgi:hypothetical protein
MKADPMKAIDELIEKLNRHPYKWSLANDDYIKINHVIQDLRTLKEQLQEYQINMNLKPRKHYKDIPLLLSECYDKLPDFLKK